MEEHERSSARCRRRRLVEDEVEIRSILSKSLRSSCIAVHDDREVLDGFSTKSGRNVYKRRTDANAEFREITRGWCDNNILKCGRACERSTSDEDRVPAKGLQVAMLAAEQLAQSV